MSDIPQSSNGKEQKRRSVNSEYLLNIKSIVTQNVALNTRNREMPCYAPKSINPSSVLFSECRVPSNESISHTRIENDDQRKSLSSLPTQCWKTSSNRRNTSININNQSQERNFETTQKLADDFSKLSTNDTQKPPISIVFNKSPITNNDLSHDTTYSINGPSKFSSSNDVNLNVLNKEHSTQNDHNTNSSGKLNEIPIHRYQSVPIKNVDLSSSSTTTSTSLVNKNEMNFNDPRVFVNSSLNSFNDFINLPTMSDRHQQNKSYPNEYQQYPMNYTRLPHSLRNENNLMKFSFEPSRIRPLKISESPKIRQYPQFQAVPTPVQNVLTFDCCENEIDSKKDSIPSVFQSDVRLNTSRTSYKIHSIMMNISKRLTNENTTMIEIPIVDTHCHFDLIFDRLRIKHNDLGKYFHDYKEFYPLGLSFELAIQVFWRPEHLIEDTWRNWYSKYLDDERVYGTCGIHPHWSSSWKETIIEDMERCFQHPKMLAIGEIGLDFGPKNTCFVHEQRRAFVMQLKLAAKLLKPIVIHSRDAYEETFQLMKQYLERDHKIHLHCFVGTMDDVSLFTSYFTEIKFGFTPIITRQKFLHPVIEQIDLRRVLSETDSPYFVPEELSSYSRCAHPGMVYSVVETIAQIRRLPVIYVASQLRENARHIYGI